MFDFEKAVVREWDLMNTECHNHLKWNFRVIDKVAGFGTAVETVFQLKDIVYEVRQPSYSKPVQGTGNPDK